MSVEPANKKQNLGKEKVVLAVNLVIVYFGSFDL